MEFTSKQFIHLMDFLKKRDTMIYNWKIKHTKYLNNQERYYLL